MGRYWSKGTKFQMSKSGDLMYRMVTIGNNSVMHT